MQLPDRFGPAVAAGYDNDDDVHLQERWSWWDRSPFTDTSTSHVSVWAMPD